jgi:two-component system, NarL family, sensor histidine kinase UhpB
LHRLKAKLDDPAQAVKNIDGMLDQVAGIVASTKRLSVNLRPSTLDQLGLVAALEWLTQEFSRYSGIPCTLRVEDDESAIPEPYATAVFRVAQEGLSNVERHAAATDVTVDLLERNGRVLLRISDNGKGITDADQRKKNCLGILSMRERAHGLSGEFSVTGRPGAGTVLEVTLPVKNVEN